MFQGCFSQDYKGPYYIQEDKTTKEKKGVKELMDIINKELEEECCIEWELLIGMRRIQITRSYRS